MSEPVPLPGVRCSNADRERISERLRDAAADGRLTMDELEDRLGGVYAAKYHHELDALVTDLPGTRRPRALGMLRAARTRLNLALLLGRTGAARPKLRLAIVALVLVLAITAATDGFDFEGFDDD